MSRPACPQTQRGDLASKHYESQSGTSRWVKNKLLATEDNGHDQTEASCALNEKLERRISPLHTDQKCPLKEAKGENQQATKPC
ncbi:MAG: hypothetical protein EAZ77_15725 [Nostocales cyanobacterium]|nr:MAG: hypothetical protein EAZ77_15725 [Nostocales cyanobacterium]